MSTTIYNLSRTVHRGAWLPICRAFDRLEAWEKARDAEILAQLQSVMGAWRSQTRAARDAWIIGGVSLVLLVSITGSEACTAFFDYVEQNPELELDGVILSGMIMTIGLLIFSLRRWRELRREVRVRKAAERRAHELAYHDPLTGLYNRRALSSELARTLSRAKRDNHAASVLMLDLDRFKPVNDVYGHTVGDQLLSAVGTRLRSVLRVEEFLARIGGDEFAVLISHPLGGNDEAVKVAERLIDVMKAPFALGFMEVSVGLTAGIAHFPCDAELADQLIERADVALYQAKAHRRGGVSLFERRMDDELKIRSETEIELRRAVAQGEIVPYFQPLVDLKTGRIAGFEALARWLRPGKPPTSPAVFIPIAEECGVINELSLSILRQSCIEANRWDPSICLSVNLSPVQFADEWLAEKVLAILVETGFRPQRLEVEITENALMKDLDAARRIVGSLKNQGVKVSLDDFGAGYSSLAHLGALPFDKIKIDRAFILARHSNPDGEKIVNAILGLSKSLGLPTTGEGVETAENASWLEGLGCTYGQGWYFGRPVAADGIAALLAGPAAGVAKAG